MGNNSCKCNTSKCRDTKPGHLEEMIFCAPEKKNYWLH